MERYWLIGGGALMAVLLVSSVAVTLLRGETEFDPGSPEYAVQQYIHSLGESDYEVAHGWLSPDLRERCPVETLFEELSSSRTRIEGARITLSDVETLGQTTYVTIGVSYPSDGGILGPDEREFTRGYGLQTFGDGWRVSKTRWPYIRCIREDPEPPRPARTSGGLRTLD